LKIYVETLAFKHLGVEIIERRVDAVISAFTDLLAADRSRAHGLNQI
jgi:hypothetical protein